MPVDHLSKYTHLYNTRTSPPPLPVQPLRRSSRLPTRAQQKKSESFNDLIKQYSKIPKATSTHKHSTPKPLPSPNPSPFYIPFPKSYKPKSTKNHPMLLRKRRFCLTPYTSSVLHASVQWRWCVFVQFRRELRRLLVALGHVGGREAAVGHCRRFIEYSSERTYWYSFVSNFISTCTWF